MNTLYVVPFYNLKRLSFCTKLACGENRISKLLRRHVEEPAAVKIDRTWSRVKREGYKNVEEFL